MYTEIGNGNGGNIYFIYSAPVCNGALTILTCGSTLENTPVAISNLNPGTTYYIRICIDAAFDVDFGVCIYTGFASVGINTPNPLQPLDVSGNASFRNKIGIGETNPQFPLTMATNIGDKISLYGNTAGADHYGFGIQGGLLQIFSDAAAADIGFGYGRSDNFIEKMRIKGNGNVGIGEINPNASLAVTSNFNPQLKIRQTIATDYARIRMTVDNTNFWDIAASSSSTLANDRLSLFNNRYGNMLVLAGNGRVGISNNNPTRPLSFANTLEEKIVLYSGSIGEVGMGVYGGELRLHCDVPGSKVSFGTQDNAGNFDQTALAQRNGVYAFSVLGSLWVNGTTYASDERFKQNITTISSPLQKLLQLKGVEYEMRTKEFPQYHFTAGRQMGLLAQNVETVVPEAVNEKDGYKGVDYARLVPLLIESIKDLNKRIELLEQQLLLQKGAN
jgi:hypothetical protein